MQGVRSAILIVLGVGAVCCHPDAVAREPSRPSSAAELAELDLAQLLQIEIPMVVGASKHRQKITEAPSSVTIVTREDIRAFGYRTLGDLLRSVPGFYTTYDRNYGFIGVRGFNRPGDYGGRVLLLLDGHRLNDPIYDTAPPANDFILDLDLIDRVEIIRGPGSALYGNNAFFAVINVLTRRPEQVDGLELAASAARFETYEGRATYAQVSSNGVEVLVSASAQDREGVRRLSVPEFDGVAVGQDGEQFKKVFARIGREGVSLFGGYMERDKDVPNAPYGTVFGDKRYQTFDQRAFAELTYERPFVADSTLLLRGYYDYYTYEADYPYDYAEEGDPPDLVLNVDLQTAQSLGAEFQVSKTLGERHRVIVGAEYRKDFELKIYNYDVDPAFDYQRVNTDNYIVAAYLQDEYRLSDAWLFNVGLRLDAYADFGETVNPRAAAIWDPIDGTTFKAIGGTAFRAPNAYERFYASNVDSANPDLDPETIRSVELIWEQQVGNSVLGSISVFHNRIEDLIGQVEDEDENTTFQNRDKARSYGIEPSLTARWANGWRGRAGYTFARAEDDDGRRLENSPEHLATLSVAAPLYRDRLLGGAEAQYLSKRRAPDGQQVDDYAVVNVTLLAQRLWRGWEASASIYNLFDTSYSHPTGTIPALVEQDGREWRVKLACRF